MKSGYIILTLLTLTMVHSCQKKGPKFAREPAIEYSYIRPDSIRAGSSEDRIYLGFTIKDGDADIGNEPGSGNFDVYIKDSRDTAFNYTYYFADIDDEVLDPDYGLEGSVAIELKAAFFLLRPDHPDRDTMHFDVYVKDRAGNTSNIITTRDIILLP